MAQSYLWKSQKRDAMQAFTQRSVPLCTIPAATIIATAINPLAILNDISDILFTGKAQVQCRTDYSHLFTINTLPQFC